MIGKLVLGARDFLSGLGWKVGAAILSAVLLATGFWLLVVQVENRHLTKVNAKLDERINDPVVGYVVMLAQSHTNVATLEGGIKDQKIRFEAKARVDAQALAASQAQLARAQVSTRKAEQVATTLLARKPRGDTLEARILDVDARLMETLR